MDRELYVTIVGAGLMGHGIAQVFAQAGHRVTITDSNTDTLEHAPIAIARNLTEMGCDPARVIENIRTQSDLATALRAADFVVEAIPERLVLKQELFAKFAALTPAHAILASNTSVIPITKISHGLALADRGRVVGTHWWNPPHLVPLVEVIRGDATDGEVFEATYEIIKSIGKLAVKVNVDIPGFIGNRLQHALWREAFSLVEAGVCDPKTIDLVVKNSFGMRLPVLGPMENADLVGLHLVRDVHKILFPHLNCAQVPSPLLERRIDAGESGMDAGKGMFEWTMDRVDEVRRRLADHLASVALQRVERGE